MYKYWIEMQMLALEYFLTFSILSFLRQKSEFVGRLIR